MILLLTEFQWKVETIKEDGSVVLDIIPTVGGEIPIRLSMSEETRKKMAEKLGEGHVVLASKSDLAKATKGIAGGNKGKLPDQE